MIKKVFIVSETGICIFHYNCATIKSDRENKEDEFALSQLLAGFFTAINYFAESTSGFDQSIQMIELRTTSFYFHRSSPHIFILETDNINQNLEKSDFFEILKQCAGAFQEFIVPIYGDGEILQEIIEPDFILAIKDIISKKIRKSIFNFS